MTTKTDTKVNSTTPSTTSTTEKAKDSYDPKVAADLIQKHGSKSGAIRALTAAGKTRGEISKILDIRYQHVRNVLITPVKNPKPAPTKQ